MKNDQLQEGDVVRLITGGPSMSLQEIDGERGVCVWFEDSGRMQERSFLLIALQRVEIGENVTRSGPTS